MSVRSEVAEYAEICRDMPLMSALLGLILLLCIVGITSAIVAYFTGVDRGKCLDWHVEYRPHMVGKVMSTGPVNVCDVWERPNG